MHQGAGRAGADFALVEERQHQAFGGFFDEGRFGLHDVFEEDVRRLATQLHGGRNDVFSGAFHDVRADRGRAGEGDLGDALAGGQGFAGFFAEALHHVQHARRQQVADQLHQHGNAQRGLFGRLEHHAVTGGEGRGEFPGGHQDREVPRDDLPDHAQRFMEVIGRGVFIDFSGATFLCTDATGVVAEVVDGQRDVGVKGFTHGFAVVPGFSDGQQFEVLFDAVGDFQQRQGAVLHRGLAPGIGGCVGSVQRLFDVFGAGAGEFGNRLAIHGRGGGEVLTVDRCDELTADVVAITGLEGNDGTGSAWVGVVHGRILLLFLVVTVRGTATVS